MMASERLVETLSAGLRPVRRRSLARDAAILAAVGVVELALLLGMGGARHDLAQVMMRPCFWWKLGTMAAVAMIGLAAALRSFDPTRSPRPGLRRAAIAVGVALALGWLIDASQHSVVPLMERMLWHDGARCMVAMAVLSLPMIAALGWLMRRSAPTDRAGTALAAGIAGAAWGAFVFVFACPHDDPLYVAIWYFAGCAVVALAGRLLLAPMARW
jgi:hypothetical protein